MKGFIFFGYVVVCCGNREAEELEGSYSFFFLMLCVYLAYFF